MNDDKPTKMEAMLAHDEKIAVECNLQAHHTGWAWDPEEKVYVLTLEREDDTIMAVANYTWEQWQEVFERLRAARIATLIGEDEGERDV